MRISDWSSDVCSSDLGFVSGRNHQCDRRTRGGTHGRTRGRQPRKCCPRQGAAQPHARFDRCSGGRSFWSCKTHPARGYWRVVIGKEACRERGCQSGYISVVGVSLKKTQNKEGEEK